MKRELQEYSWATTGIQTKSNRAKSSLEHSISIQATCPERPSAPIKMSLSNPTLRSRTRLPVKCESGRRTERCGTRQIMLSPSKGAFYGIDPDYRGISAALWRRRILGSRSRLLVTKASRLAFLFFPPRGRSAKLRQRKIWASLRTSFPPDR